MKADLHGDRRVSSITAITSVVILLLSRLSLRVRRQSRIWGDRGEMVFEHKKRTHGEFDVSPR
jgi:uncharacterized membrane protein YecN with MAPEG domain